MRTIIELFNNITPEFRVLILASIPVVELRGAIPLGIAMGMGAWKVFALAVLGNSLPIVPLMLYLEPLARYLSARNAQAHKFFNWLFARTRRHSAQVDKYGAVGLMLFVAIPLPGTGAWTGAILAFLLGIRFWYAFWALFLGVIEAGILVTLASLGVKEVAHYFIDWEIAGLVLLLGVVLLFLYQRRKIRNNRKR